QCGGQYQGGEGNAAFHERSFQRWCELGVERQGQSVTVTGDIEPLCSSFPSVGARRAGSRSMRRNSWAFRATTMVEADIKIAPTAGDSTNPIEASTPAASGTARML